jgi:hypothetical protein
VNANTPCSERSLLERGKFSWVSLLKAALDNECEKGNALREPGGERRIESPFVDPTRSGFAVAAFDMAE